MTDEGNWIKIYRKIIEDPIFKQSTPGQVKVLLTMMCLVKWTPTKWDVIGHEFTLQPGELFISSLELARRCGLGVSREVVRKSLIRFEKLEFCTIKRTKRGMLIHIVNWRKYQGVDSEENHMENQWRTNGEPMENHTRTNGEPTNNKEGKKERKKESKKEIYIATSDFEQFAGSNQALLEALKGWAEMRELQKKPLTERAVKISFNKLNELSGGNKSAMIAILNQSTMNNWIGLFPLKEPLKPSNKEVQDDRRRRIKEALKKGAGWSAWTNHQNG